MVKDFIVIEITCNPKIAVEMGVVLCRSGYRIIIFVSRSEFIVAHEDACIGRYRNPIAWLVVNRQARNGPRESNHKSRTSFQGHLGKRIHQSLLWGASTIIFLQAPPWDLFVPFPPA